MLGEEAGDLIGLADELERRASTHEKVISQLDLPLARVLRALASRIRKVVDTSERNGDRDAVHGEVVGLRLEAMCALLEEPLSQPPPVSQPVSSGPRALQPTPISGSSRAEVPAPGGLALGENTAEPAIAVGQPIARIRRHAT